MKISELKIKVMQKYYFGYLQGVIVKINGKKYPRERNHVYADNKNNKAIKTALIEGCYHNDSELVVSALQKELKQEKADCKLLAQLFLATGHK